MKKGRKEKMTLDKLAMMTARGFIAVDKKIDGLDKKFATKDDFKVLVDDICLLRDEVKDNTRAVRSVISLVAEHDKEIDFLKTQVGV